jgi:F420-0:gamma-glutamyl ligase-like protein
MDFYANEGKVVRIQVGDRRYDRHAIQTRFVNLGDDYIELVREYVLPIYQPGDILSSSEKIIALCQNRVVREEEVKPSLLAKILCKFVHQTAAGPGAGVPYKMQFAINHCGALKVLWAAFRAALDKLRGVKGTFYKITGPEVAGLDGFYGHDIEEYAHMGIRIPENPDGVCDEIYEKTGVVAIIVDANALAQEVLGKASILQEEIKTLEGMIKDNPAGQEKQMTPFILIREVKDAEELVQGDAVEAASEEMASQESLVSEEEACYTTSMC